MTTPMKPLSHLTVSELARVAHDTHVARQEPGHAHEVHFQTCRHPACAAIRQAIDAQQPQPTGPWLEGARIFFGLVILAGLLVLLPGWTS